MGIDEHDFYRFRTYIMWFVASVTMAVFAFLLGALFLTPYQDAILGGLTFLIAVIGGSMAILFAPIVGSED